MLKWIMDFFEQAFSCEGGAADVLEENKLTEVKLEARRSFEINLEEKPRYQQMERKFVFQNGIQVENPQKGYKIGIDMYHDAARILKIFDNKQVEMGEWAEEEGNIYKRCRGETETSFEESQAMANPYARIVTRVIVDQEGRVTQVSRWHQDSNRDTGRQSVLTCQYSYGNEEDKNKLTNMTLIKPDVADNIGTQYYYKVEDEKADPSTYKLRKEGEQPFIYKKELKLPGGLTTEDLTRYLREQARLAERAKRQTDYINFFTGQVPTPLSSKQPTRQSIKQASNQAGQVKAITTGLGGQVM